jgi:four helix bundle protein
MIESFRDLDAWKLAMDLAEQDYRFTRSFPREEMFSLTSQIRRAASSVPANIAGGYGRETTREYLRSLRIAQGRLKELETHIELARRVGLVETDADLEIRELADRTGRVLRALIRSLRDRLIQEGSA